MKTKTIAPNSHQPDSSELHHGPGYRIRTHYPVPPRDVVDRLAKFDTPTISDNMNRIYALDSGIQCLTEVSVLAGSVCTVNVFPGDNLMVHKALDTTRPGDVIMINAHGAAGSSNAVLGDLVATKSKHRGIRGFIVDGLIRDLPGILEVGIPVFARGTTAVGPLHRGPGEINYPIACGGVVTNPGDLVVADSAGVVVIPLAFAADLATALERGAERAATYLASVQRGDFSNAWVDELLEASGCEIDDRFTGGQASR